MFHLSSVVRLGKSDETGRILSTAGFWGHNFGSRHGRRSIKGCIDADDRLVSKKILSHKNGSLD